AVYPPGSIIKPLVLATAVTEGVYDLYEPIPCTGHFYPEFKDFARCWIYRDPSFLTHGALVADEALARSCNIFFYTMAKRLDIDRLLDWYGRFGLGRRIDIGLAYTSDGKIRGEARGMLPGPKRLAKLAEAGETKSATIFMGIGQGPIAWTPVQAANAYATLARGGAIRDATLLRDEGQRSATRRSKLDDLHLDQHLVETIMEGLRQSVQQRHGTGYRIRALNEPIINAQGVTVWAKTGTAQASPWRAVDTNGDGKVNSSDEPIAVDTNFDGQIDETDLPLEDLDHAWFVGLVGPNTSGTPQPKYAIVVIVEYGGSGGKTAGPIANQIIHALQLHGYLPQSGP
ncbi:MAG: penicillin-binding transpeptidase domain-containing protein, partial [Phycisphaerales bacterium]